MRDIIEISLPTLAVLVGILLNRNDANRLEARIASSEARLDARITALESRFHADIMLVIGKLTELEARITRIEAAR
jgi:hypothetical protein